MADELSLKATTLLLGFTFQGSFTIWGDRDRGRGTDRAEGEMGMQMVAAMGGGSRMQGAGWWVMVAGGCARWRGQGGAYGCRSLGCMYACGVCMCCSWGSAQPAYLEQVVLLLLPVNHKVAAEKPVAGVLCGQPVLLLRGDIHDMMGGGQRGVGCLALWGGPCPLAAHTQCMHACMYIHAPPECYITPTQTAPCRIHLTPHTSHPHPLPFPHTNTQTSAHLSWTAQCQTAPRWWGRASCRP